MKKIICLLTFIIIFESKAHQPVLNDLNPVSFNDPYLIKKPEISKAIYSTLQGKPHLYKISSDVNFKFYVGITVPKIESCSNFKKFSFQILDTNKNLIEEFDGKNFKWWSWYEKYGKKWYWVGPETGADFKSNETFDAGDYYIKVFNEKNMGNYVLATGDDEKFGPLVIAKLPFILPKINKKFWGSGCNS
mgnify:CR=1 FL=1|jgi:hypothetical protein|tara:strand:- start:225 stop:794 length:570 start_codon:yes stop_codon:yes gene_type:complete